MDKELTIQVELPVIGIGPDAESTNNKVSEIVANLPVEKYPNANAVWNLVQTIVTKIVTGITDLSTDEQIPTAKAVKSLVDHIFSQSISATSAAASAALLAESAATRAGNAAASAEDLTETLNEDLPVVQDVMSRGIVIVQDAERLLSEIKTVSYTADFRENQDTVVVVNLDGDITITDIAVSNVATLKLTHGSTLQQVITPGSGLSINIAAGEHCIWEITRVNESARAYVGVKYTPDRFIVSNND